MKKYFIVFPVLLICLDGCNGKSSNVVLLPATSNLSGITSTIELTPTPSPTPDEKKNSAPNIIVNAWGKQNVPKDTSAGRYSDVVLFSITVENNTDKDIKGIQGTLDIQDMFSEEIMSIKCDLTGDIMRKYEKTNIDDMGFERNQFKDDHNKVYTTEQSNLIMVYTIKQVLYLDGSPYVADDSVVS